MTDRPSASKTRRGIPAFSVLLLMAALSVVGAAVLPSLSIQYAPSAAERRIGVNFSWYDASARLVEQRVTSRIEGALSTVSGCESVSSTSSKGGGSVSVSLRKGTDMTAARFEVATAIRNLYPSLPPEVSYPEISVAASGRRQSEAIVYTIKADLPSKRIEEYVTARMTVPLSQIGGVEKVSLSGVTPFEWVIEYDPGALHAAGLGPGDLAKAFNDTFRSDVIGMSELTDDDGVRRSTVLKLRNRTTADFGEIPVAGRNGRIYRLGDFATARWREALPSHYFRINGLNTVNLSVTCAPGSNILRVTDAVRREMTRLEAEFPEEISATLTYDASEYIAGELHKIYLRTLLCVALLLLFVLAVSRDPRYLAVIAATLAVNLLVAAVFYRIFDLNIHIYTLAGITVSLGIIIDTSIIMVDHYSYHRDRRAFVSILGALLTTVGALAIVWLLPEEQQANLVDFSLVIVINLTVSLLTALLFVPALLDTLPLRRGMTRSSFRRRRRVVRISHRYGRMIGWGRRRRWLFVAALVWGFGIPTFLLPDKIEPQGGEPLSRGAEWYNRIATGRFMTEHRQTIDRVLGSSLRLFSTATGRYNNYREPERKVLYVNAGMPEGCTVQQLDAVVRHMENYISRFDEVAMFRTRISSYDYAMIEITFRPQYENTSFPSMLKQELMAAASDFGGATWRVWGIDDNSFNNNIANSYKPYQINLRGYNYDELALFAERLIDTLARNRRVSEPEIMDGNAWSLPRSEFDIRYDDERIAAAGLDMGSYFRALERMLCRTQLASVYDGGRMQRAVLESSGRDEFDRWHIENAQLSIDTLETKLSAAGSIRKQRSAVSIRRHRQSYEIMVGFDFIGSYELGRRLIDRTLRRFNEEVLPIGFKADSPTYNFWNEGKKQQVRLILLVVAIIYAMCAVLFESLRKPLVVVMMIPVSFIGVFLLFGGTDFVFDQGGFAAFVLLCGIVVNAGIYLIREEEEWSARSRKRGIALYLKAFNHKIIPIMLTMLSTVLGLIPFLYDGPGEVFWFAFAAAAIGGTLFSVVALLVYLPVFLPFHESRSES